MKTNYNDFFNFIKKNEDIDLDIYDSKNIYVVQYIINLNRADILEIYLIILILE